jgi:hypothetical protein
MRKITFLIFLLSPVISFAQIDFGTPSAAADGGSVTATAKDWQAIEINPANLGWSNNDKFSLSIANVGVNIQSNQITYGQLKNANFGDSITPLERQELYNALTAPGGLNVATTINWFSFSMHMKKWGGIAISLTDKAYSHIYLSKATANVLDSGQKSQIYQDIQNNPSLLNQTTVAQTFQGTSMGGYQYRELNIDYGNVLLTIPVRGTGKGGASFENSDYLNYGAKTSDTVSNPIVIYGGFGIKPIWGVFDYNSIIDNGQNIEQGTMVYWDPSYIHNTILSNAFTANGRGLGLDLGLSASYKRWKLGLSATDLGKITWQNPEFANTGKFLPVLDSEEMGGLLNNKSQILNAFVNYSKAGYTGQPNFTTELPSKFRTGISYKLNGLITLSSDFVAPLNSVQGNLINPYLAAGARISIFSLVSIGVGIGTEKGFGNVVPLGVYVNFIGGLDFYVATNDAIAFIGNGGGHDVSASAGIRVFGF